MHLPATAVVMPAELHGRPLAAAVVLRLAVPASRPIAGRLVEFVVAAALPVLQLVAADSRVIPAFGGRRGLPLQQRQSCWKNVNVL